MTKNPTVSVIMPVYNGENFIARAIHSLLNQSLTDWELIIVNDGSTDETQRVIETFLHDHRILCLEHLENRGLGASINHALNAASAQLVAYLPADDLYYSNHLESLVSVLENNRGSFLAFSSFIHHYNRRCEGVLNNTWYQMVQVMHRKTEERWIERSELESDDLNRLFWFKISNNDLPTGNLTCEWVDHPEQRHKIMQEPLGGINTFRSYYQIKEPLCFHSSCGNLMDEKKRYARFRNINSHGKKKGLKILLVGELAYNPERILALEERGHQLYGLWMQKPYWYNYVGPLPFGKVQDISYDNWQEEVRQMAPDVIYALLNFQAVPLACEVMKANTGIPFVWHFKEGPMICREKGTWNEMVSLFSGADANIYCSGEMKSWVASFIPERENQLSMILDGDLPKKDWFADTRSPLLSESGNGFHTVVPGRPIGLHPYNVVELAEENIHLHFYGDFTQGQWREWIEKTERMAPGYLHIHPNADQENWVEEFSKYDAGWLHFFQSENYGEITRANWDDLNLPARISTLAIAGLPMLQKNNDGHMVAMQSLVKNKNMGLFFNNMHELKQLLSDKSLMKNIRQNVWEQRSFFTFDHHADELVEFFRKVIQKSKIKSSEEKEQASLMIA